MLSPPSSKKLSSMPTRSSPSTSANSPHRIASCGVRGARCACADRKLRRRQRPAVELAVRRQRQTLEHHDRRRHHVVRQLPRQRGAQRRRVERRARRRHHVADQPLAARAILARDHRGLRTPGLRSSAASISPGSMRKPRIFTCSSARPEELQHAVRPPAAPGRRCGTSGSRPRRTGRRRTAPPSAPHGPDSPAPARRPRCTARPQHPPEQAQDHRPKRRPGNWAADGRWGRASRLRREQQRAQPHRSWFRSDRRDW